MSAARPLRSHSLPLGGLSVDVSPGPRTGELLAKRAGMQARPWAACRTKGAT